MIYNKDYETMPRDDIEQLQIERLQTTMQRVYRNVAFYKQKFDEYKVNIEKIRSVDDLKNLPFTTREDLINSYPYGMFAVPLSEIVRIHSASASSGKPVVIGYTKNDIRNWSELVARLLTAGGITKHDLVQIALNYSLFTGAFGYHYGAELAGASVIPSSSAGDIRKQIMIMKDYKTTAVISTPGYALRLANTLSEMKLHPEELSLKLGLFSAEPLGESLRSQIEERLHITATDNYGLSEVMGPGVAGECGEKNGLHINEDHFIAEVIDPQNLAPVRQGEVGELVFTTITKEGFPLIRYRTGDMASLIEEPCVCGRTFARLSRVPGRADDMLVVNGLSIFPPQIGEALIEALEIRVELPENVNLNDMRSLYRLKDIMKNRIENSIGMEVKISLVESNTLKEDIARSRVVDKR
jgi:phenylacetate-CoA ligase